MRSARKPSGFTLAELLVVTAIVMLLIALAVPAVQKARASADRVACANKLRQIGVALHLYDETHKQLPPGCSYEGDNVKQPHMSWLNRILPFIDEDALWLEAEQAFAQEKWFEEVPPHYGLTRVVTKYLCPSDGRKTMGADGPACTNYLGVQGINQFRKDGMLFLNSKLRLSDATDGTSTTLLVGERPASSNMALGWWYAGWGQDKDGSAEMILGVREHNVCKWYKTSCPKGQYEFIPGNLDDPCAAFHFWSLHPGGAHFLLCDGSVHFLRYSANPVLPALATRRGGERVDIADIE